MGEEDEIILPVVLLEVLVEVENNARGVVDQETEKPEPQHQHHHKEIMVEQVYRKHQLVVEEEEEVLRQDHLVLAAMELQVLEEMEETDFPHLFLEHQ